jgi:hypothetical protein
MITYILVTLACMSAGCEYERTNWQAFRLTVPAVFETLDECENERTFQVGTLRHRGFHLVCVPLKDRKSINSRVIEMQKTATLVAIPQTCPADVPIGQCSRPYDVQVYPSMRECLAAQVKIEGEWHKHAYITRYRCRESGGMP